jgi:NAD-dependent dihydropyrimidine dehydrogenase PreA subunit
VTLADLQADSELDAVIEETFGSDVDPHENSAILKDEDRCIRCALCEMRCPVNAITMERATCTTEWRTS